MKSVSMKNLVTALFAMGCMAGSALATYDNPWLPNWESETGYTSQFWGLNAVDEQEPAQPLAADIYSSNSYGTATASWVNDETNGYVTWAETLMGQHPSWASGVYGGMTNFATFDLSASVNTGADTGALLVFVQYDWYAYAGANLSASIAGATEITPAGYYDYQIGQSGSGHPWARATQVFEITNNPGNISVAFGASGFATAIESFSITTAIGDASALVPLVMPVPEPATMLMFGIGSVFAVLRRKK